MTLTYHAAVLYIAADDAAAALRVAERIEKLFMRTTEATAPYVYIGGLESITEDQVEQLVVRRPSSRRG